MDAVSDEQCAQGDWGCRQIYCPIEEDRRRQLCEYRENCREERTPAPPVAEVTGTATINIPGITGQLGYTSTDDIFDLSGLGLGAASTVVAVNGDQIIGLDINPGQDRTLALRVLGLDDNMAIEISPSLHVDVMFAMHQIDDAIVDLPSVFMDETISIDFGGSETPRLETVDVNEDEKRMKVMSGVLTLSSTAMDSDVVIGEGLCMDSQDDESLSDEERDAQHDLFGGLVGVACEG